MKTKEIEWSRQRDLGILNVKLFLYKVNADVKLSKQTGKKENI